jgi:hypothetical protein
MMGKNAHLVGLAVAVIVLLVNLRVKSSQSAGDSNQKHARGW